MEYRSSNLGCSSSLNLVNMHCWLSPQIIQILKKGSKNTFGSEISFSYKKYDIYTIYIYIYIMYILINMCIFTLTSYYNILLFEKWFGRRPYFSIGCIEWVFYSWDGISLLYAESVIKKICNSVALGEFRDINNSDVCRTMCRCVWVCDSKEGVFSR